MEDFLTLKKNGNIVYKNILKDGHPLPDEIGLKIKNGDEQSFELFFRMYYVRLCSFANKFLNDPEEAKEIVQTALAKIWEGRNEIKPEVSLKSYIFKITQNLCLNALQRKKVESRFVKIYKVVYYENHEHSNQESLLTKELENKISNSIEKLPTECRNVFELSRIEGHKYKEIAEICNISCKTVEAQISKALRFLRIELKEYIPLFLIASIII